MYHSVGTRTHLADFGSGTHLASPGVFPYRVITRRSRAGWWSQKRANLHTIASIQDAWLWRSASVSDTSSIIGTGCIKRGIGIQSTSQCADLRHDRLRSKTKMRNKLQWNGARSHSERPLELFHHRHYLDKRKRQKMSPIVILIPYQQPRPRKERWMKSTIAALNARHNQPPFLMHLSGVHLT